MNKQEAVEKTRRVEELIASAQAQLVKLKDIIDAPDPLPSLLTKPLPGSGKGYWQIKGGTYGELVAYRLVAHTADCRWYEHGSIFQTETLAREYSRAINIMLLLRHQPGSVPSTDDAQCQIEVKRDGSTGEFILEYPVRIDKATKMNKFSPCFVTEQAARDAVQAVGEERLLHMFKTLSGLGV